jgi:upstream activation factor subunit UAF30
MAPTTTAAPKKVVAKSTSAPAINEVKAAAPVATEAPATEAKKVVKKVVKKAEAPATPEVVAAPAPVAAAPEVVATPVAADASPAPAAEASNVDALFAKLISQFTELQTELTSGMKTFQTNLRTLQKEVAREQKEAKKLIEKSQKKKRVVDPSKPRTPSGIAKPAPITNELCDFLGVAHGTQMSRIDVIKKVNEYITTHNLKNPENKQTITPDAKLQKLLSPPEGAIVKFFNLQTYLKKHFPKVEAAPVATA